MTREPVAVNHVKFGKGMATAVDEKHVSVVFEQAGETKLFMYPQAFGKFLRFVDEVLQQEAEELLQNMTREQEKTLMQRNAEYAAMDKQRRKERIAQAKKKRDAKLTAAAKQKNT